MSLYCISDPHLSISCDKPMDVFGGAWKDYVSKLEQNWVASVKAEDTVVIPGDISWGMNLKESLADFAFLDALPGKEKIILKGNHDLWFSTKTKKPSNRMVFLFLSAHLLQQRFFNRNGLKIRLVCMIIPIITINSL